MDADTRSLILSHSGRSGARLRLAVMSDADKVDMTAAARAARAAKYLERVKQEIDPTGALPEAERERRARDLVEARAAKAQADKVRREHRQRLLAAADDELNELLQHEAS